MHDIIIMLLAKHEPKRQHLFVIRTFDIMKTLLYECCTTSRHRIIRRMSFGLALGYHCTYMYPKSSFTKSETVSMA